MDSLLEQIKCNPQIEGDRYLYNGNTVPRITEILAMIHEDYLMGWANHLGFKGQSYKKVVQFAADIGSAAHDSIEKYLKGIDIIDKIPWESKNALDSFIEWYTLVSANNEVEILGLEERLVCQWFGGTYDMLIKINGKIYLVDFKTSNHVGYKYFIQASAYAWLLKTQKNITIDGIVILQLSKKEIGFNEYILDLDNPIHVKFMEECTTTFFGLVYTFYNVLNIKQQYNQLF